MEQNPTLSANRFIPVCRQFVEVTVQLRARYLRSTDQVPAMRKDASEAGVSKFLQAV